MSTEPVWCSIAFFWVSSLLMLLQIALGAVEPPCMYVQYIEGGGGRLYEYIRGIS